MWVHVDLWLTVGAEFPSVNKLFLTSLGGKLLCNYDFSRPPQTLEVWGKTGYRFLFHISASFPLCLICWNHPEWRLISKVDCASVITAAVTCRTRERVEFGVGKQQHFDIVLSFSLLPLPSSLTDHFLHAAVSSVCDAQPGRLHPLLPKRSAGQLSGRLSAGETNWTLTCACSNFIDEEKVGMIYAA